MASNPKPLDTPHTASLAHLDWNGRPISLEYQWVGDPDSSMPVVVFLHEGLGSISMWKDYPEQFCRAFGFKGLVYSRYGHGHSTPRPRDELPQMDFMHRQAIELLPALLRHLGISRPWLFGHSDGASIALIFAARLPDQLAGAVVVAPHILVEDLTVAGIAAARPVYEQGGRGLRAGLARYHADVDSVFYGWNDVWLKPEFRQWNIEDELKDITCPLLAVQGDNDEYGTMEQVYGIARRVPHAKIVALPDCGHSPHRDQPEALTREAGNFIISQLPGRPAQPGSRDQ